MKTKKKDIKKYIRDKIFKTTFQLW